MDKVIKSIEFIAKPLSFEKVNSQLTRCRCYVIASGRNINRSDITLEAIKNSIPSLYNMPLVARLFKREDGKGWAVGSHDSEWIWNADDELEIVDLTVPYGVVPENCNPVIEEVLEPDGITTNSYLVVDVLIWSGRYNIMDAAYSDDSTYFNQSAELFVNRGHHDSDGYYIIEDYTFSALCVLGKSSEDKYNKRPCFPSARIEKIQYSLDEEKFKQDLADLMQEIKIFNATDNNSTEPSVDQKQSDALNITSVENDISTEENYKKEGKELAKKTEILFSDICDKIKVLISENKFEHSNKKEYAKYIVLSINESDSTTVLIDRENYSSFRVGFIATQTQEGLVINFDFENKKEMQIGAVEKTDAIFDVMDEVKIISDDTSKHDVEVYSSAKINDLMTKLDETTLELELSKNEVGKLTKQLGMYEAEKRDFEEKCRVDKLKALVKSKEDEMGKFSEYLEYCQTIDYSKKYETVEKELKDIRYNFMDSKNPSSKGKQTFSVITTEVPKESSSDMAVDRWGDITKYLKKNNGGN